MVCCVRVGAIYETIGRFCSYREENAFAEKDFINFHDAESKQELRLSNAMLKVANEDLNLIAKMLGTITQDLITFYRSCNKIAKQSDASKRDLFKMKENIFREMFEVER